MKSCEHSTFPNMAFLMLSLGFFGITLITLRLMHMFQSILGATSTFEGEMFAVLVWLNGVLP